VARPLLSVGRPQPSVVRFHASGADTLNPVAQTLKLVDGYGRVKGLSVPSGDSGLPSVDHSLKVLPAHQG